MVLRPWQRGDRRALIQMSRDRDMMRFVTRGQPMSHRRIQAFLKRQEHHLKQYGTCFYAMELCDTARVVGLAGLQPVNAETATTVSFELGWWVWKDYWGQGLATEAAAALVTFARNQLRLNTVFAVIDPDNLASIRVAEKLGFDLIDQRMASATNSSRPDWLINFYQLDLQSG